MKLCGVAYEKNCLKTLCFFHHPQSKLILANLFFCIAHFKTMGETFGKKKKKTFFLKIILEESVWFKGDLAVVPSIFNDYLVPFLFFLGTM